MVLLRVSAADRTMSPKSLPRSVSRRAVGRLGGTRLAKERWPDEDSRGY
jgi:hypothetical protein